MFEVPRTMLTLDRRGLLFGGKHVLAPVCPETGRLDIDAHLEPVLVQLSAGYRRPMDERTVSWLKSAAKAWNKGDAGRTAYDLIQVRLPDPKDDADFHQRIDLVGKALADGHRPDDILKALNMDMPHWMTEARVPAGQTGGGQWTSGSSSGGNSQNGLLHYVADKPGKEPVSCVLTSHFDESKSRDINMMKEKFVTDHMHDACVVANKLGISTSQILGLAALEGKWGKGDFVKNGGNNYFSQHYPAPGGGGPIPNHNVAMAQYPSFSASAESFRRQSGSLIQGITDPTRFVQMLQEVRMQNGKLITPGRYGIDTDRGKPDPGYVTSVVEVIRQIGKHIRSTP